MRYDHYPKDRIEGEEGSAGKGKESDIFGSKEDESIRGNRSEGFADSQNAAGQNQYRAESEGVQ